MSDETTQGASNSDIDDGIQDERLLAAARTDNEEMLMEVFESKKFDINFQDGLGNTVIISVINGSTDVLEHILSHEACDVDPINKIDKETPLHLAVKIEHPKLRLHVVESLLDAGANTRLKNKYGEIPLDLVKPQDEDTKRLIRKANAQSYVDAGDIADDDDGEPGSGSGSDDD
ncbi:ankyrin [Marasmius fiardii PR-910]|nr:ankyrin [Marasmius fiardii PR-910]